MPPKFRNSSFQFEAGETVPDHIEGYPSAEERDPSKVWLEGEDTFSGDLYPLAIDLEGVDMALLLKRARFRELNATQPSETSGGQTSEGIQDRVHVRLPGEN